MTVQPTISSPARRRFSSLCPHVGTERAAGRRGGSRRAGARVYATPIGICRSLYDFCPRDGRHPRHRALVALQHRSQPPSGRQAALLTATTGALSRYAVRRSAALSPRAGYPAPIQQPRPRPKSGSPITIAWALNSNASKPSTVTRCCSTRIRSRASCRALRAASLPDFNIGTNDGTSCDGRDLTERTSRNLRCAGLSPMLSHGRFKGGSYHAALRPTP